MKVLLIQPPIEDFYDTEIRHFPLGLAYLKASIRKSYPNLMVKIIDFHHGWGRRTIPIPAEFRYLKDYYPYADQSPFCLFNNYFHFGADYDDIAVQVENEQPDLIGISSLFSAYHREVLATAAAIRRHTNVPIAIGGAHASAMPELMLRDRNIDYVILGEGERPLLALIGFLQGDGSDLDSISGLGYRNGGVLSIKPQQDLSDNIDYLPIPDCSDWAVDRYRLKDRALCFILTSRGCPYHCSFCSVKTVFGRHYARRSNDSIISEMAQRYCDGYRVFNFEDDNLAFEENEFMDLLITISRRFPDVELTAMNGINYTHLSLSLLEAMYRAGFRQINLSLVTEDSSGCASLNRFYSFSKFREVVLAANQCGLGVVSYLILGLPNQSLENAIDSLVSLAQLPVTVGASPFYLAPGSKLFSLNQRGDSSAAFFARLSALNNEHSLMTRDELYSLFVLTRIINFVKSLPQKNGVFNDRDRKGLLLLKRLTLEKTLFAATKHGFKPLTRFDPEVFRKLFAKLTVLASSDRQLFNLLSYFK